MGRFVTSTSLEDSKIVFDEDKKAIYLLMSSGLYRISEFGVRTSLNWEMMNCIGSVSFQSNRSLL